MEKTGLIAIAIVIIVSIVFGTLVHEDIQDFKKTQQ
jgi:hypothetical protein